MRICIFEDALVLNLQPLALTRPAFDLRSGATTLLDKQLRSCGVRAAGALVRPDLADLCRLTHAHLAVNDAAWLRGDGGRGQGVVLVNARWMPPASFLPPSEPEVGLVGDQVAYVSLPAGEAAGLTAQTLDWRLTQWKPTLPRCPAGGTMIDYPWDLVERHAEALEADYRIWREEGRGAAPPDGVLVVGPMDRFLVDPAARVEPMVLIDTTRGPVMIDRGAVVQAFSRIEGPCYVGPRTQVLGAKVRGGSFGPECRVGGEVEASIMQGYANKAHEGFLGHSYLGEWVNLGAGTHTSDLRTDYGKVHVSLGGKAVDTGLMKVGAFVGDHTKTSLATLFNTGTVVGPFGQLLTSGTLLPRSLPAFCRFAHGQAQDRTDLREMFATARIAMGRRGHEWTEAHAEFFLALYERTTAERRQTIRENEQRRLRRVV
jgi:UDP-N-acetylglucosamine diphosphorylase / glucose-1-phosphate thymidylyltransferase / UDP-N-acetylgalactosamine diphosphorylase / glucosamine-1-phosphate N-acetyltransferase / galactosamine-1-phosphate N-acetyltransferase